MNDLLRHRARELGFDDCRVTTAAKPESGAHFQAWLAAGHHGAMAYLQRNAEKRLDPQRVLEEAQSIISLAASYGYPTAEPSVGQSPNPIGRIAKYACFADYHAVAGERLQTLTAWVNHHGGPQVRSLWYVDTGPFLERDLAQRAGLGFVGKHTNLISRHFGNWVFLAQIITTARFDSDPPEVNRCGTCTRCLTACPTQAIIAPFHLDARLCISYLTIELKGAIPTELRPAIGNRIFGCDDCLAVCPWNRFAREGRLMRSYARPEMAAPDLIDLLSLDEAGFQQRFRNTPLTRIKRCGLLRNACVALGNVGDARALPVLRRAASEEGTLVAEHALWAIEQIQHRG